MDVLALENQKNVMIDYIEELNFFYKTLDDKAYKYSYENEQYISEEFLDNNLLSLMKNIIFIINDYSKRFARCTGFQSINNHSDMSELYYEKYEEQERNIKKIYNDTMETYWNQIPDIVKQVYILSHVAENSIDKKERYKRFLQSIYILKNSKKEA